MKLTSILTAIAFILAVPLVSAQKVETVDGVRVIHNEQGGKFGKKPGVALEKVRTLSDVDTLDENLAFYMPSCIIPDKAGNIYILDTGNHRIQKFGPDGKFVATIGRQGQGPGEFVYPSWLDLDASGNLYVADPHNNRIQILTPDGKEKKTIRFVETEVGNAFLAKSGSLLMGPPRMRFRFGGGDSGQAQPLPKIVKEIDLEGKTIRTFGDRQDFKDELLNTAANDVVFTVDGAGQTYLAFTTQNRIDKYAADGRLLWRADRGLDYSMEIKEKGKLDRQGGNVSVEMPRLNRCTNGIAVDGQGRIWVVTFDRQLKREEQVSMQVSVSMTTGGGRTVGYKPQGDTDLRKTNAYKIEIFDPEGILLGEIPLDVFADGIFIFGDRLFLMDSLRGTQFHEYKIK